MSECDDDVAIVGSGFGGSVTALRAADTGTAVYEVQEVDGRRPDPD